MRVSIHHYDNCQSHTYFRRRNHHYKKNKYLCIACIGGNAFATGLNACIFENATSNRFTAFNINSTHIKMMIAFRRINTPIMPMINNASAKAMYALISIIIISQIHPLQR